MTYRSPLEIRLELLERFMRALSTTADRVPTLPHAGLVDGDVYEGAVLTLSNVALLAPEGGESAIVEALKKHSRAIDDLSLPPDMTLAAKHALRGVLGYGLHGFSHSAKIVLAPFSYCFDCAREYDRLTRTPSDGRRDQPG